MPSLIPKKFRSKNKETSKEPQHQNTEAPSESIGDIIGDVIARECSKELTHNLSKNISDFAAEVSENVSIIRKSHKAIKKVKEIKEFEKKLKKISNELDDDLNDNQEYIKLMLGISFGILSLGFLIAFFYVSLTILAVMVLFAATAFMFKDNFPSLTEIQAKAAQGSKLATMARVEQLEKGKKYNK